MGIIDWSVIYSRKYLRVLLEMLWEIIENVTKFLTKMLHTFCIHFLIPNKKLKGLEKKEK